MTQFAGGHQFHPLREVEAYWLALRDGGVVPRRSDIDPRGIEQALEFAFVAERVGPGLARLRIAGSHLTDLLGMEVCGMPLTAFFESGSRRPVGQTLDTVFSTPAVAKLTLISEKDVRKPKLDARMILLPLKSDAGDISRVLGCIVAVGDIGPDPRRFEILDTEVSPLATPAKPASEIPYPVEKRAPAYGMAEEQAGFESTSAPHLRLVRGQYAK